MGLNALKATKDEATRSSVDGAGRAITMAALSTGLALMSACRVEEQGVPSDSGEIETSGVAGGLPVGFDRTAGYINFASDDDAPSFSTIETEYPVLHFTGSNLDSTAVAYTSLAKLKLGAPLNREPISHEASLELTLDDLVPTGELVVEKEGKAFVVSRPNEAVTFAAWSPTDPNIIAYTYAHGETYGIAVADIDDGESESVSKGDFAPDFLAWSDDGNSIGLNIRNESLNEEDANFSDNYMEFPEEVTMHWQTFDTRDGTPLFNQTAPHLGNGLLPSDFDTSMEVKLSDATISIPDVMGGEAVVLDRMDAQDGISRSTFHVDQLRHRSNKGIAYVNLEEDIMTLFATNGEGDPMPISSSSTVSYYIPTQLPSTVTFTQVGYDYSGNGCNVSSHYNGSGMDYAIDIQLSGSTYDKVLASGAGSTYAWSSSVTCNSADTSSCADYSSSCSSNGGWGNYVIMSHADGYYTKYTHLEATNFKVVTSACTSAARGCWLADEGHTGTSSGNKYDTTYGSTYKCGDHIHFQRQSGGSRSSSSVTVSLSESGTPTSSSCTTYTALTSARTCSL